MVGWSVTNRGAAVRLRASREPRAYLTEFGAETQPVGFDTGDMYTKPQSKVRGGRTTRPWANTGEVLDGSGYVIQPTIRRMMPAFLDGLADDVAAYYDRLVERGR